MINKEFREKAFASFKELISKTIIVMNQFRLLIFDKNSFWKKIASFKRSVNKRATFDNYQPSLKDFSKCYKELFSHSYTISN